MKGDPHGVPPTAPPQPWPSAPSGYGQGPYAGSAGYPAPSGYEQGYGASYGQPPPSSAPGYAPPGPAGSPYGQPAPGSSAPGYGPPPPPTGAPPGYGQGPAPASTYTQASAPPYGQPPPPAASSGYGQVPTQYNYGQPPPSQPGYGQQQQQQSWPQQQAQPFAPPQLTGYSGYGQTGYGYGVAELFPPGTDPDVIRMFQQADRDGSGQVDDVELQKVLSQTHPFSAHTVRLLTLTFSATSCLKIRPTEFASLWKSLKEWRKIFDSHDRDRSGRMDCQELQKALLSIGCQVSNPVLKIIVSRYDRSGLGKAIDYENFIECALIVKGLTDKFKEKDVRFQGSATLSYEEFMLMVLPFLAA